MRREDRDEKIDLNLDEEPIAPSPLENLAAPLPESRPEAGGEDKPPAEQRALPEFSTQALVAQFAKLQAEKDDLKGTLVRRQADFENYRKRIERERREDSSRAIGIAVESLLPVLDAFERALAAAPAANEAAYEEHRKGFELIYRQLVDGLARLGLEPIAAEDQPFDPHLHQAVERIESADYPDGTVVAELQRGYKFRERLLRPAMVRVSSRPAGTGDGA
jgi:molecular chaperone GrpE